MKIMKDVFFFIEDFLFYHAKLSVSFQVDFKKSLNLDNSDS